MELHTLYKSLYEREQDIRLFYDSRISITLATTTAIVAADIYLLNFIQDKSYTGFFACCINIIFALIVISLIMLFIYSFFSYASFKYRYLDFPVDKVQEDIDIKADELSQKYRKESIPYKEALDNYIDGMLARVYNICASKYHRENIRKRRYHHLLNLFVFLNALLITIQFALVNLYERGSL